MDIQKYFERINFSGKAEADFYSLRALHFNHLLNIPFENLDIHRGKKIFLEPELLYNKIVLNKRGGFCYEMNGLFYEILKSIGFNARMVSARVYDSHKLGPEFDHMAVIVTLDHEEYLADVGFGDSFMEPLRIESELIQKQNGKYYRLNQIDNENCIVTFSTDGNSFDKMYRFSKIPRKLEDFSLMCTYHQTSPESHFTRKRMCTIARADGRITLSSLKIIETKNGVRNETDLKTDIEFDEKLKELFGIDLSLSLQSSA